jgi:ribulose-5-phosphate 4-epimerase/fuculose-1-phosphate aldolase
MKGAGGAAQPDASDKPGTGIKARLAGEHTMNIQAVPVTRPDREAMSPEEWEVRVELAAAHRLMAHFGIQDLTHNHLTARVPGEPGHFLIKPADFMFDEVTASSLVKYDFDGNPRQDGSPKLCGGGLIIHAGLLAAREDLNVIFHTHTPAIIGVASQKNGLLPINQHGIRFIGKIAYHDFGGFEFDMAMRSPLVRDLGDRKIALLRNHGSLVCGASVGEAFVAHHNLDFACQAQIAAMAGGADVVLISEEVRAYIERQQSDNSDRLGGGGKDWQSCLRLAGRLFPDFQD